MNLTINRVLPKKKNTEVQPCEGESNKYDELRLEILQENLRQAIKSFDMSCLVFKVSLVATAASVIATLTGSGLLLAGKISEGTFTTCMGVMSGTCFSQLSKEAQERLEKANNRLHQIAEDLEAEN